MKKRKRSKQNKQFIDLIKDSDYEIIYLEEIHKRRYHNKRYLRHMKFRIQKKIINGEDVSIKEEVFYLSMSYEKTIEDLSDIKYLYRKDGDVFYEFFHNSKKEFLLEVFKKSIKSKTLKELLKRRHLTTEEMPKGYRNQLKFLLAKINDEPFGLTKRKIEHEHLKKFDIHNIRIELCGIDIPNELVRIIFSYLPKTRKVLDAVGPINENFYLMMLSQFDEVIITDDNLYNIPFVVLSGCRKITLRVKILIKYDFLYIRNHTTNMKHLRLDTNSDKKEELILRNMGTFKKKKCFVTHLDVNMISNIKTLNLYPQLKSLTLRKSHSTLYEVLQKYQNIKEFTYLGKTQLFWNSVNLRGLEKFSFNVDAMNSEDFKNYSCFYGIKELNIIFPEFYGKYYYKKDKTKLRAGTKDFNYIYNIFVLTTVIGIQDIGFHVNYGPYENDFTRKFLGLVMTYMDQYEYGLKNIRISFCQNLPYDKNKEEISNRLYNHKKKMAKQDKDYLCGIKKKVNKMSTYNLKRITTKKWTNNRIKHSFFLCKK